GQQFARRGLAIAVSARGDDRHAPDRRRSPAGWQSPMAGAGGCAAGTSLHRCKGLAAPMSTDRIWTAALVVIGDEILSGRTHDRNIAQVASWLQVQGIRLAEVRVVPDVEARIVEAVNALRASHDYLFTTGGIGPTHDDITVDAIARALGVPVVVHPEARAILESYYATRGGLNEARLRMARVPAGADLIPNGMSGAPGIRIGNVYLMAGVPHIAAQMLEALTGTLGGCARARHRERLLDGRCAASCRANALSAERDVRRRRPAAERLGLRLGRGKRGSGDPARSGAGPRELRDRQLSVFPGRARRRQ